MQRISKHLFPTLVAICIVLSSMIFSVSAENVDGKHVVDLFDTGSKFYESWDGENFTEHLGNLYQENITDYYFRFTPETLDYSLEYLFLNVYKTEPTAFRMYVQFYGGGAWYGVSAVGNWDHYFQYKVNVPTDIAEITIHMHFPNGFTGGLGIYSIQGFVNVYENVTSVNVYDYMVTVENGVVSSDLYRNFQYKNPPFSHIHEEDVLDGKTWMWDNIFVDIQDYFIKFNTYDSLEIIIDSSNTLDVLGISLYQGGTDDPLVIIPVEKFETYSFRTFNDKPNIQSSYNLISTYVKVDLKGYDLEGYTLDINFSIEPESAGNGSYTYEYLYYNIRDVGFTIDLQDLPWYTRFWRWMSGGLNDLGDKIVTAINGDPSGGAMAEAGAAMSDQGQSLQNANDELASVNQPDVDVDQLLNGITFDPVGVNILSGITQNKYAASLIVIVFTFVLLGFILFGKKR